MSDLSDPVCDTRPWFDAFAAGQRFVERGVRMERVTLASHSTHMLLDEDQSIAENATFTAPLFLPDGAAGFERLTVLFHGLNEGTEAKLFPWAVNLARRRTPALIFPSSFHLARRPQRFLIERADAFASRRDVPGNERSSPYNATLSRRMAAQPERFLRGTMQTWRDVVDLARGLRDGGHPLPEGAFAPGARLDFLGYSIGGYLAELALLANPEGLFADSRAVLFSTGAALAQVRPQTILILDTDAQDALTRTYDTEQARAGIHPLLPVLGASADEARWLTAMLYATDELRAGIRRLGERVLVIANENDQVFPVDAVRDALEGAPRHELALGLHELPFNQSTPLGETYSDREGRRLLITVVKSYAVAEALHAGFARFIDLAAGHLAPSSRG